MPPSASQIRQQFIDFFAQRASHDFVPSSPVVPHDDPTLLFTNAGMNQFKPIFLGQVDPSSPLARLHRAVNSQKCIRAGGKHNDLDDVGKDTYHHTFFEMLGNWSFGDYFKREAIQFAWELLTDVWGLDPDRLYATYFEGNKRLGLPPDREAYDLWLEHLPPQRVIPGNMKDNFWEMGDTGPCGPCSEVHYDGRTNDLRARVPGYELVNRESPDIIEIWNLVFIQFNRTGPTSLEPLPAKHVDTGMGFERIVRFLQGKTSNYDTDVFSPLFDAICDITGARPYKGGPDSLSDPIDTAYRVIADHARTLTVAITDGAEPSNDGRGYVLRRILRRAVRYGRQTLGAKGPFMGDLVPTVVENLSAAFPETATNPRRVIDILTDEEEAFGRTLDQGIDFWWRAAGRAVQASSNRSTSAPRIFVSGVAKFTDEIAPESDRDYSIPAHARVRLRRVDESGESHEVYVGRWDEIDFRDPALSLLHPLQISAEDAFQLHDTYGFPIDLTELMSEEQGLTVDSVGFVRLMEEARERSRVGAGGEEDTGQRLMLTARAIDSLKHLNVSPTNDEPKHDDKKVSARITAIWNGTDFDENLRASNTRPADRFAIVLDKTNCYAEAGGQVADTARFDSISEARTSGREGQGAFIIESVRNCAGYIVHIGRITKGEIRVGDRVEVRVDRPRRNAIAANHTATHLLNLALRNNLGDHVDQKGSLVAPDRLRFDFSHNAPLTDDEAARISAMVRQRIQQDLPVHAKVASLPEARAIKTLRAVFGETYPDPVRVVAIGADIEDLIADRTSDRWMDFSVEFCGGTHLPSTGPIDDFALVAEEGVSKGVRRIVALTGLPAAKALERARALRARLDGAATLDESHLAPEVTEISDILDHAEVPLEHKAQMRTLLAQFQDRLKSAAKQAAKAGREHAVEAAKRIAAEAAGPVIVEQVPAGSDRHALLAAMDTVRAKHQHAAVMLLSADTEESKVAIVAQVPKQLIEQGVKAGDWVRVASQACGGKGGGKPDSAQGGGTDPARLPDAIEAARAFVSQHTS